MKQKLATLSTYDFNTQLNEVCNWTSGQSFTIHRADNLNSMT
jgi:hypothetical protein